MCIVADVILYLWNFLVSERDNHSSHQQSQIMYHKLGNFRSHIKLQTLISRNIFYDELFLQQIFSQRILMVQITVHTIPRAHAQCSHLRLCTSPSQKQQTHPRQLLRQMSYDSSFLFHSHSVSIGSVFCTLTSLQPPPPILLYIHGSCECNSF